MMNSLYDVFLKCGSVSTDTRNITTGTLFFALKGDNFDANLMIGEAFEKGAAHVVTSNENYKNHPNATFVDDTLITLQQLATFHRSRLKIPVVGITGTNGKTTTKELISKVLSAKYATLATHGNLNNHIGVPLTLLSIDNLCEMAVVEMGANHPGEIELLCNIANPDCGLITNVGKAHLEGFGSFEGVKKTKSELYRHLQQKHGLVFINGSSPYLPELLGDYSNRMSYGNEARFDVSGHAVSGDDDFLSLRWRYAGEEYSVKTHLVGNYNLENVLAAIAVGLHFNISPQLINEAVIAYQPSNNRSQKIVTHRNSVFMDAYNANPSSMALAIDNFNQVQVDNKLLILGGMKELGGESAQEHLLILEKLSRMGGCEVFLVGSEYSHFKNRYAQFTYFDNTDHLCLYLKELMPAQRLVLVKGSRSNRLERVVEFL